MVVTTRTSRQLHSEKLGVDQTLAERKVEADIALAERKFALDQQQLLQNHRFEVAEAVLADAYRFRDLMVYVRNGFAVGEEGSSRKPGSPETDDLKRLRDTYFVPVERLHADREFISAMMVRQHAARSHFGEDARKAFDLFHEVMHRVRGASSMLIEMSGTGQTDIDLSRKLRADIWAGYGGHSSEDELGGKIEESIVLMEGFCRPALERQPVAPR